MSPAFEVAANRFSIAHRVAFPDCDPAGIVYYPRYFDMMQRCKEAWYAEVLGSRYAQWFDERATGFPTRALHAEFLAVSSLSEVLSVSLSIIELGGASMRLRYQIHGPGRRATSADSGQDLRMQAEATLVTVSGEPMRPVPIPDDLRGAIEAFVAGHAGPAANPD